MITLRAAVASAPRKGEDRHYADERLVVVADGMGGVAGGARAAEIAVATLSSASPFTGASEVIEAIEHANQIVNSDHSAGGSTLCALVACDSYLVVANVGDSRCYRYGARSKALWQVTEDHDGHSVLRKLGERSPPVVRRRPASITRWIGKLGGVDIDSYVIVARENDRFVLCSDGVSKRLSETALQGHVSPPRLPVDAVATVRDAVLARGLIDDATVCVVDVVVE